MLWSALRLCPPPLCGLHASARWQVAGKRSGRRSRPIRTLPWAGSLMARIRTNARSARAGGAPPRSGHVWPKVRVGRVLPCRGALKGDGVPMRQGTQRLPPDPDRMFRPLPQIRGQLADRPPRERYAQLPRTSGGRRSDDPQQTFPPPHSHTISHTTSVTRHQTPSTYTVTALALRIVGEADPARQPLTRR